jgi:MFS family permease
MKYLRRLFSVLPDEASNKTLFGIAWMSFFWSMASLMVFSLLPMFMTEVLHLKKLQLGMIEGIAISLAFLAKIVSGVLSDYVKTRKPLIIIGTVASLVIKSMFALATSGWWIFFARAIDRVAKGVRSAPTDALIADIAPKDKGGASYGVRQTLYTMGAVVGSLIASALMHLSGNNYRFVFWMSLIPTFVALLIVIFVIKEPKIHCDQKHYNWNIKDIKLLPRAFWQLISVSSILMMARFSESFLSLRGRDVGIAVTFIPLVMVGYEIVHSLTALPIGKYADKNNRQKILLFGISVLILTNCLMITTNNIVTVCIGFLMAGLHMGLTQGLIAALIAENTLPHLRGTAFSIYYLTTGLAVLLANPLAGYLHDTYHSSKAPFVGGLIFTCLSAILLLTYLRINQRQTSC